MSVDLDERIERGLADLAVAAPLPAHWLSLDQAHSAAERAKHGERPARGVRLAVAIAAAVLVVVGVAVAASIDKGAGTRQVRAAGNTAAPDLSGAPALGGTWSDDGPRLTDDQLAQLIQVRRGPDGSARYLVDALPQNRGGAPLPDATRAVVGVSVAKATPADLLEHFTTEIDAALAADDDVEQSLAATPLFSTYLAQRDAHDPSPGTLTIAWVETTGAEGLPDCGDVPTGGCALPDYFVVWMFGDGADAVTPTAVFFERPFEVVSDPFGPLGHWSPG